MRPRRTTLATYPDTVVYGKHGLCGTCYTKALAATRPSADDLIKDLTHPDPLPVDGWEKRAACQDLDTDMFYAREGERRRSSVARQRIALRACELCPVRLSCLEAALIAEGDAPVAHRHGIWGGFSGEERAIIYAARQTSA